MSYYDAFLAINNGSIGEKLAEEYQEVVNEMFENSSTYYEDIESEEESGTLIFTPIAARITVLVDNKTGERVNDDYRKILFQNFSYKPLLGQRYRFDNNIWIVCSINNIKSLTSSAYLRRCNNTINVIDKYGNIHKEPCVVNYQDVRANKKEENVFTLPEINNNLLCQCNKWTVAMDINTRFMLDARAFKIYDRQAFDKRETFADNNPYIMESVNNPIETDGNDEINYSDIETVYDVKLVKYFFNFDNTNEYDNKEFNIADYYVPKYTIEINSTNKYKINNTSTAQASVYLDSKKVIEDVHWYSADETILTINKDTGNFQTLKLGSVEIIAKLVNNESYSSAITVEVVENILNVYENHIIPETDRILLGRTTEFEVYEILNNNKISTQFSCSVSGMDSKYYEYSQTGNKFYIKNIKSNALQTLVITCINLRDSSKITKTLELGGLY